MKSLFSERYGHRKIKEFRPNEMPDSLKKRIWNFLQECVENPGKFHMLRVSCMTDPYITDFEIESFNSGRLMEILWDEFFEEDLTELRNRYMKSYNYEDNSYEYRIDSIRDRFYQLKWYEIYDLIEFIIQRLKPNEKFVLGINKIFEEERSPYKVINGLVTPLTSEIEVKEVEWALDISDEYRSVRTHLKKALEYYSKRPQGDYKNSIKESISSLEGLARIVTRNESATLGALTKELKIHPALKAGLNKIYGWTSDEGGVRHAEKQYPAISANKEEARLMLVLSSAFVNYIIAKYEKSK